MSHALIIDDNMIVSRAVEDRLVPLGFDSFDHTWTESQAIEAAQKRAPDLVVIGDTIAEGSPIGVARRISNEYGAPVVLITAANCSLYRRVPEGVSVNGRFKLSQIHSAVALSRHIGPAH